MFSKKPQGKKPRSDAEFWRSVALLPFGRQAPDQSYRSLIDLLDEVFECPAYYFYVALPGSDSLNLEFMDIRRRQLISGRASGGSETLEELLENPAAQLRVDQEYRSLQFIEAWAGSFLNLPLLGEDETFLGMVLAGPMPARALDGGTKRGLTVYSIGIGTSVKKIRESAKLRGDLEVAATRARVTQRVLGSALEVDRFVSLLLDLALTASKTEAGFVAIAGRDALTIRAWKNLPEEFLAKANLSAKGGLFEWSLDADDVLILQDYEFVAQFGVRSVLAVPLVENKELRGIFALINFTASKTFEDQSLTILKSFCEQIKLVLNNSRLFEDFTRRYIETLKALSDAYDVRSPYGAGHSQRVAAVAVALGKLLGLDAVTLGHLELAAAIHDVGMCGVVEIKSGYRADFNHPTIGASLVEVVPVSHEVSDAVRTHQEWYDGWGYPEGLKGESIPLLGRILAVAEYYEEIQSGGDQGGKRTPERIAEDLETRRGTQFDPRVVDALKQYMRTR